MVDCKICVVFEIWKRGLCDLECGWFEFSWFLCDIESGMLVEI